MPPRMSRRRAVAGVLLAVLAAAGCTSTTTTHPKPAPASATRTAPATRTGPATRTSPPAPGRTRPNFVFVLTDDLSWNLVSHMPHVLAMQKAGMTFDHYYVVDSLCCPSRSAIFTGEFPHDDGVFTNAGADGGYFAFNKHGDQ